MNVRKYIWTFCLSLFVLQACVNDLGNYDYIDRDVIMPVKINGLRDTIAKPNELLKIVPDVQGITDESRYEYYWYVRSTEVDDTLARTRDLSYEVHLSIGEYELYYEIKDPEKGIYVREMVTLEVSSQLSTGWYVVKDINGQTDFDFIPDKDSGERWDNVILSSGNELMQGEALKINYINTYTNEATLPDGTVELQYNQQAFLIGSTEDLKIFNANTMELFKDYNTMFYEAPETCRPQNFYGTKDLYLLNDGKLYTIAGNYANSGKFGYFKPGTYDLHDDILVSPYGIMVFDKNTRSFMNTTVRGNAMDYYPDSEMGNISPTNMDMDLIRILPWSENGGAGYALMDNKGEQTYSIIKLEIGRVMEYPFATIATIPYDAGYEVFESKIMATSEAQCIYFAQDNILKVYKNIASEDREEVLKEFPSGETITYISPLRIFDLNAMSFLYYVEVLTNTAEGWKLYRFDAIGSTPEINPEPSIIHEGEGTARYVMYRSY